MYGIPASSADLVVAKSSAPSNASIKGVEFSHVLRYPPTLGAKLPTVDSCTGTYSTPARNWDLYR